MIRELTEDGHVLIVSTLRVEIHTLAGEVISSREPTPEEAARAADAPRGAYARLVREEP